ncbi:MAG: hypothetical protein V4494_00725 [Chlamydiota bacterium]
MASTLDINNVDFLGGLDLLFAGNSQEGIINRGMITAWNGDVVLISYKISNEGEINASAGVAALGVGREVLVTPKADQRITIHIPVVNDAYDSQGIGLSQEGVITALQAELKADGNPYALAIQNKGFVNAVTAEKSGGRIFLVAQEGVTSNTGVLEAVGTNHIGGEIQILGKTITMTDGAVVDVSGDLGGGHIFVGGGYQGLDSSVFNAQQIFIDDSVVMKADAIHSGNGGQVIVWSDWHTTFFGNILACGGQTGGHGGFVEVSSKNTLDYFGFADRRAPFGTAGTLLLDPSDLTISNAVDANISFVAPNYTGTAAAGNINIPNLLVNLGGGSVTISTTSGFAGGGDIVFLDDVTWVAGANTLTLNAVRNIVMSAGVTFNNSIGSIAFNAGTTADGSIIMVGTSALTMSGTGTLAMSANNTAVAGINLFGTITYTSSGAFTIDTSAIAGEINIGGGGIALATTAPLTITSAAGSDINITDSINNSMAGQITVNSGNNFYLQGELVAGDTLTVNALQASLIGTSLNQTLIETSSGDLNVTCETLLLDTNAVINLSAGTGVLNVTVNAPGNCLINNGSSIQSASTPIGNAAILTLAGDLTIQGGGVGLSQIAVTGGSDLTITTTGDLFALNNALIENSTAGATTITVMGSAYLAAGAGPVIILGGTGDLNVLVTGNLNLLSDDTGGSSITSSGNLVVTSTENIYIIGQPGANDSLISTSAGNLTVSADAGNLELTNAAHITLTGGTGTLTFSAGNNLTINNDSSVESASSMDATGSAGNALLIVGGTDGNASIVSAQGLTFTMGAVTGSIDLMTVSSGEAFISVGATSSIATGMSGTLSMNGLAFSVNAYIEASTGDLTVTASRMDMNNFSHIEILGGAGLLTVDATAGDFSLANGSYLTHAGTGGISSTTTVGYLYIEGGPSSDGGSYIDGGSGASTITAHGIQMSGYSSSLSPFNGARITSSGDLTVTAALADLTMNPFSYIESTGTGLLDIEVITTDLLIDNGSSIVNLGSGITTINVAAGTISLLGGAGDSLISVTTGPLNVTAGSNVRMLAHEDGSTSMTATTGDITVDCGANLLMVGAPESMQTSFISTEGSITINATNNVIIRDDSNITIPLAGTGTIGITTLNGDLSVENGSSLANAGSGTITATVGMMGAGNVLVRGGTTGGNAAITVASDGITLNIPNGNLNIESVSGGSASITAVDTTSITTGTSGKISIMGFSMAFPATVSSTAGDLTVTGGSLDMKDFSTISLAGAGALTVTGSMGDIRIENASEILHSGSGLTTVDASGFEMVLQSGASGAASITGGSGGATVNAAALLMTGFDATGSSITATGGDINVTSTGDATLSYLSSIHLTGGMGTLNLTTTGDLVVLDGSSVQTDAAGPYVISVGGTSILASGASAVIIASTVSVMASSYTVAGSLFVLADGSGSATISAVGPLLVTSTIESIHLIGSSFGGNPASITTSAGALRVIAAEHITLYDDAAITLTAGIGVLTVAATAGDLIVDNGSNIQQQGTGILNASAGGNALVKGGLAGNSSILNNSDMTVTIGGSLDIQAVATGSAIISANGTVNVTAIDKIKLSGFSGMSTASIFDLSGDLTVSGSSVELIDFSNINLTDMIVGTLSVQSTVGDIVVYNNSFIQNTSVGGTTTSSPGSLFIIAGADGDATIFPGAGIYTLTVTGDLNLIADVGGGAYITANGPIMAAVSENVLLNGFDGTNFATISTDATLGDLIITAGNKVNVQNHALITMGVASTGNLSVTATTGDLTVENDATIISPGSAGILTIASTLGNVIVRAGAEGEALVQGMNDLTLTAGGAFEVEALSGMEAAVLSGGDTTISVAGAFRVLGFDPLVRARVESDVGIMSISVDGVTTIYPHASILLTGGAGTFTMTLDDDMVLGNDSIIRSDAVGAMSINITGSATVVAGAGNAIVSGTVTTLSFITTKNIFVLADETGFSEITSGLALTVQSIDGSISVIGSLSGSNIAAIHNGLGTLDVTAATDISLQDHGSIYTSFGAGALTVTATGSNINIINDSFIEQQGTGSVTVVAGADILIKSGFDGSAFISGNDTVDVTPTGNLDIEADLGGSAYISGADTTNVIAMAGRVRIAGNSFLNDAYIQTTDGDLTVTGVSFDILDFASINLLGGVGTLTVNDLLGDFRVSNVAFIRNLGTGITNINAANSLFITGGTDGAAGIIYTTGVFNLNVLGDINLQADIGGGAFISGDADLIVTGNSNIAIVGEPSGPSSYFTTTTGIINVAALGQIVIRDNAFIDLTGGIGDVTVSTVSADLVIENNAFVRNQGTGNQIITSGANLTVRAGAAGDAFIFGDGTLLLTAVGQLDVEAQLLSSASVLSNGDTLITANTINMLGSTTLVPATIVNATGNMTIFAGLTTLTAHSGITLLGGIGNFLMVISDDLIVANDSAINILSAGMTGTILVSGSATLLAGAGDALIFNNTDTFTMIAANNLSLISDLNGAATIITNGLTGAVTAASILVNGDSSGLNIAEILATSGDLSVTATTNMTVSNNASILISSGAGTLTAIATTGDLNVQNDSFLGHLDTGNVIVTVGANGLIKGGPLGASIISGNADVSYTGTGSLTIEAVATGAASILGSGTMTIIADTLEMLGNTTLVRASIINSPAAMAIGDLIITIARHATVVPYSDVFLTSGLGVYTMTIGEDLVLSNDSFFTNTATGAMTITVGGSAIIAAGVGNAIVEGVVSTTSFTAAKNIFVLSDSTGISEITSGSSLNVTSTGGSINVNGSISGANSASINNVSGPLTVTALTDITLQDFGSIFSTAGVDPIIVTATTGNFNVINNSFVNHLGTGSVTVVAGADALIKAGFQGPSFVAGASTVDVTTGGNLDILADSGGSAFISGQTTSNVTATGRIRIAGDSFVNTAFIQTLTGNLTVTGGSYDIIDFGSISLIGGVGILTVNSASGDFRLSNASFIRNLGTGTTNVNLANSLFTTGGSDGAAGFIYTTGAFNLNVPGLISFQADLGGGAFISGANTLTIIGNDSVSLVGVPGGAAAFFTTSAGAITVSAAGGITVRDNAFIDLSDLLGAGAITLVATDDIVIENASFVINQGTGSNIIVGGANVAIRGGASGDASIVNNGPLTLVTPGLLDMEGQVIGAASMISNGTTTIVVGQMNMRAFTALQPATILNQSGDLTILTGLATLSANANITLSAGVGNYVIVCSDDLFVDDNSSLNNLSAGMMSILVTNSANFIAGAGSATLLNLGGMLSVNVGSFLNLIADPNGFANFTTTGTTAMILAENILLSGDPSAVTSASIVATQGTLAITAVDNITVRDNSAILLTSGAGVLTVTTTNGDLSLQNAATLFHVGTGDISMTIGANCNVIGGFTGPALIQGGANVILVAAGDLNVEAASSNPATLFANNLLLIISDNVKTKGFNAGVRATLASNLGDLIMVANNLNHLRHSTISINSGMTGDLIITLAEDLVAFDDVEINNISTGATTTILAGGNATFSGGALGAASILSNALFFNVSATGDVTFSGTQGGNASLTTDSITALVLSSAGNVYVTGDAAGSATLLTALGGSFTILANNDIHFYQNVDVNIAAGAGTLIATTTVGDINMENLSSFSHLGTGAVNIVSAANAAIFGGNAGLGTVSSNSTLTINAAGNIEMGSRSGGAVNVFSNGDTTYIAGGHFSISGYPGFPALASNASGNLDVIGIDITVANIASVLLTGGVGTYTMTALINDINLLNDAIVRNSSTGTMSLAHNRNLNMIAGAGPVLVETVDPFSGLVVSTSLIQGDLIMVGDAMSSSIIRINGGSFTASIAGRATLDTNALITNTAGAGAIAMALGGDLFIDDATINHLGTGTITITTFGDFILHENSTILGNNDISLTGNNLLMDAPGAALLQNAVISGLGTMTITMGERILLTSNALITNQVGSVGDMNITSTSMSLITGNSGILHQGTGDINHISFDSLNLLGGPGDAFIQTNSGDITLNVTSNLTATSNDSMAFATNSARINSSGDLTITANNVLLGGQTTTAAIPTVTTEFISNGNITITAQVNIALRNGSIVQNASLLSGQVILIADNAFPTVMSGVGPGHIFIDRYSQVINSFEDSHTFWYTSAWGERGLPFNVNNGNGDTNFGKFNGSDWAFFFDPTDVPAATGGGFTNTFSTYFPTGIGNPTFENATTAFFYKVTDVQPPPPPPCPPCPPSPAPTPVPSSVIRADRSCHSS